MFKHKCLSKKNHKIWFILTRKTNALRGILNIFPNLHEKSSCAHYVITLIIPFCVQEPPLVALKLHCAMPVPSLSSTYKANS
jgi:hypothetical protein